MLMLRPASRGQLTKCTTIECANSPDDITLRLSSLKTMMPTRRSSLLDGNIPRRKGGCIITARWITSFIRRNDRRQKQHPAKRGGRSRWDIDHSWRRRSKELERHSLQTRHVREECRHKEIVREYRHHSYGRRSVRG